MKYEKCLTHGESVLGHRLASADFQSVWRRPRQSAWIDQEEERSRLTREALADVDAGRIIDHQAVQAWADSLSTPNRCR